LKRVRLIPVAQDGYLFDGFIPERGRYPSVSFRYRPALPEAVFDYLEAPKGTGKLRVKAITDLLLPRLHSWDVVDDRDEPTGITRENLERCPYDVLSELVNQVCSYGPVEQEADQKNFPRASG